MENWQIAKRTRTVAKATPQAPNVSFRLLSLWYHILSLGNLTKPLYRRVCTCPLSLSQPLWLLGDDFYPHDERDSQERPPSPA